MGKKQKNMTREFPRSQQPMFDKRRESSVSTNEHSEDSEEHKHTFGDMTEQTTNRSMTSTSTDDVERQSIDGFESVSSSRNSASPTPSSTGRSSTASFNP